MCLDCTKSMHTDLNINVSFVVQVNFDHAWAEHCPITLIYYYIINPWRMLRMRQGYGS